MRRSRAPGDRGFSLAELVIAAGVAAAVLSAVVAMLDPANAALQVQPESADVEQRVRLATITLQRDLLAAGGGSTLSALGGPIGRRMASIVPARLGRRLADPPQRAVAQRITVISIDPWAPQSILAAPLAASAGSTDVALGPWCPDGDSSCGFRRGMSVVVYDLHGAWSFFSITAVTGSTLMLDHHLQDWSWVFNPGTSVIAEGIVRTYQLAVDQDGTPQLVQYDGGTGADVPVVSHVTALSFAYFGEPAPPAVVASVDVPGVPLRTTYGPPPPAVGSQPTTYPPGENCAFTRTAEGAVAPRLVPFGEGPALVPLSEAQLTDGPWCPDERSPNRYDADLLRVRLVTVSLRVEAAAPGLRGTGPLFSRPGTATGPRVVADRQSQFAVAPRALNFLR